MLYERRLHHHETDGDGVCHFSNYLRIFDEAFCEALVQLGMPLESLSHSFAVTEVHTKYLRPLTFGELFQVEMQFSTVRRSFLVAEATIGTCDDVNSTLTVKLAAVSRENNTSTAVSEHLRAALANIEKEEQ